jgi:hypothetical protein
MDGGATRLSATQPPREENLMGTEVLERRFAEIGARVKVEEGPWLGVPQIDVRVDRRGEYLGSESGVGFACAMTTRSRLA